MSRPTRLVGGIARLALVALAVAAARAPAQDSPTISVTAPLYKSNKKGTSFSAFTSSKSFFVAVRLYSGVSGELALLDKNAQPWQESFIVTAKSVTPSAPSAGAISSPIEVKRSVKLVLGATNPLPEDLGSISLWMTTQVATLKNDEFKTVYFESPPRPVGVGALTVGQPISPASVSIDGQLVIDSGGSWVGPPISGPVGGEGPTGPEGPQGAHGPAGAQGMVGPTGPQGAIGPPGPQGDLGPAGTQGDPGPTGSQGLPGVQGPLGPPGAQGTTGALGNAGVKGVPGPQGIQGELGPEGPAGAPGAQGSQGPTGSTGLLGPTGPTGPKGAQGVDGPVGAAGLQGPPGSLGPQGPNGETGPQGPAGIGPGPAGSKGAVGPQGTKGPTGAQGPPGLDGQPGPQGDTGPEGPQGLDGLEGPVGLPGVQGFVGAQGAKGALGSQGAPGPVGPQGPQGSAGNLGAQGPPGNQGAPGTQGIVGNGGPQGPIGPEGPSDVTVVKSVDETVVSSTFLQNDNELSFAVQPAETWFFDAWLIVSCPVANPGLKLAFSTPAGTAVEWSALSDGDVGTDHPLITGSGNTDTMVLPSDGSRDGVHLRGAVITGSVAGTVRLQWAQNSSSINPLKVEQFSYIRTRKL